MIMSTRPPSRSCEGFCCGPPMRMSHVDAVLLVDAVGDREIEAAVLGLRAPVGLVAHLVERLRGDARARHRDERGGAAHQAEGLAAVDAIFRVHGRILSPARPIGRLRPGAFQATDMPGFRAVKSRAGPAVMPKDTAVPCSGKRQGRKAAENPQPRRFGASCVLTSPPRPGTLSGCGDSGRAAAIALAPGRMPVSAADPESPDARDRHCRHRPLRHRRLPRGDRRRAGHDRHAARAAALARLFLVLAGPQQAAARQVAPTSSRRRATRRT